MTSGGYRANARRPIEIVQLREGVSFYMSNGNRATVSEVRGTRERWVVVLRLDNGEKLVFRNEQDSEY